MSSHAPSTDATKANGSKANASNDNTSSTDATKANGSKANASNDTPYVLYGSRDPRENIHVYGLENGCEGAGALVSNTPLTFDDHRQFYRIGVVDNKVGWIRNFKTKTKLYEL
tara:strand:+ start:7150 stop:7488 length:339 start_codon:yes stop_codon:yes gene_type:complete